MSALINRINWEESIKVKRNAQDNKSQCGKAHVNFCCVDIESVSLIVIQAQPRKRACYRTAAVQGLTFMMRQIICNLQNVVVLKKGELVNASEALRLDFQGINQ